MNVDKEMDMFYLFRIYCKADIKCFLLLFQQKQRLFTFAFILLLDKLEVYSNH